MPIEADILNALMLRINALGLGYPVAWPNVNFTPPADQKYLAVAFMPASVERVGLRGDVPHRRRGLAQVSVYWPRGAGIAVAYGIAGQVADGFPADLKLAFGAVNVRITQAAEVAGMLHDEQAVQVPVSVYWETYA